MILLDTHIWIWFLSNPEYLSKKVKAEIERAMAQTKIMVSSISIWETALLVSRNRLKLKNSLDIWLKEAEKLPFISYIPVDNHLFLQSVQLPSSLHNDPADRIIIATAMEQKAILITKDKKLRDYPHVESLW